MHVKNERHRYNQLLFWAQCHYTKIAQRIFKHSNIQYTIVTPDKILNSSVYRTLFYVNTYGSYNLSKNSLVFLAHPVLAVLWMTSHLAVMGRMPAGVCGTQWWQSSYVRDRGRVWCQRTFDITDNVTSFLAQHARTHVTLRLWARRLSVCPPIHPSVMLVNCDHIVQCTADILILYERTIIHSRCLTPTVVGGEAPFCLKGATNSPCTLLRGLKFLAIFLHRCAPWPSFDFRGKFYGDCPRKPIRCGR